MRLSALLALASKATLPPHYRYGMSRPGSLSDKRKNPPWSRRRPVVVEPISDEDWHLFCGDMVRISRMTGRVVGNNLLPLSSHLTGGNLRRQRCWEAGQSGPSYSAAELGCPGGAEHGE